MADLNLFQESEEVIRKVRSGEIPVGSIIYVQWPSGNGHSIRVHGWSAERNKLIGCHMQFDNKACEEYDLSIGVVRLVEKAS